SRAARAARCRAPWAATGRARRSPPRQAWQAPQACAARRANGLATNARACRRWSLADASPSIPSDAYPRAALRRRHDGDESRAPELALQPRRILVRELAELEQQVAVGIGQRAERAAGECPENRRRAREERDEVVAGGKAGAVPEGALAPSERRRSRLGGLAFGKFRNGGARDRVELSIGGERLPAQPSPLADGGEDMECERDRGDPQRRPQHPRDTRR